MSVRDFLVDDLDMVFDDFGEDVEYRPQWAETLFLSGVFDREYLALDPDTETYVMGVQPALRVRVADLPLEPETGDRVLLESGEYELIEYQPDGPGMWLLRLREVRHASA
ncbi:MAG: hypothetical protein V3573_06745 [Desulfovibrionaceae bacterium]